MIDFKNPVEPVDWDKPVVWSTGEEVVVIDGPSFDGGLEVRAPIEYVKKYRETSCMIMAASGFILQSNARELPRVINRPGAPAVQYQTVFHGTDERWYIYEMSASCPACGRRSGLMSRVRVDEITWRGFISEDEANQWIRRNQTNNRNSRTLNHEV
jgi:hypothetical protein